MQYIQFDSTAGLLIFLVALSFPVLALTLPFANNWYQNHAEMVDSRLQSALLSVQKFRDARRSTYSGSDSSSSHGNDASE